MSRNPRPLACVLLLLAAAAAAQSYPGPMPAPPAPPIAAPADTAYPGVITLAVDLSDVAHRVINVRETIPVAGDSLTLLYPQWIPGDHSPTGPIARIAGLVFTSAGRRLAWKRDPVNVFAFRLRPPQGAQSVQVTFQYLAPQRAAAGRISFSDKIVDLSWNTVLLYPAGHFTRDIRFAPSLRLPPGWKYATALATRSRRGDDIAFPVTPLNTLVDSPVYAGVNYERLDLSSAPDNHVYLDVFADTPRELAITPEELQWHRNLVRQAALLFASRHYAHYDFLLSVSDTLGYEGLEHHQSSEDGTSAGYFTDWKAGVADSDLLAHEYTHSWNGKFRRPAGLWTPNFNVPMRDGLLWVYEGLTQYWGCVLSARAGLRTPAQTRDVIARIAADLAASPGRTWRPLLDTTNQPTISQRGPVSWVSWQRDEDYYMEGLLIWLDADTEIRQLSGGRRSLDDFAKSFFGVDNGSWLTRTYNLDDLVAALNAVQPYDWMDFFRRRVYDLAPEAPLAGITRGGYRLVYNDQISDWMKLEDVPRGLNLITSLGLSVAKDGTLTRVLWNGPAFKAGLTLGMKIIAVNGESFDWDRIRAALLAAEKNPAPIRLLLRRGDRFLTASLAYHDGLRLPHLERVASAPDRLDAILAPR